MKLGSLFSGAGTCEYAALFCGMEPVWASEIEPFPVSVTAKRFPHTHQLGDITLINGAEIEPVDIIAFGSPCQDLSVAGSQQGMTKTCPGCNTKGWASELEVCPICGAELESTRSGLFLEAIRVIREMREATNGKYPRFILWENVPGAFTSQKGEDFRTVLEEICRVKDPERDIPRPKKWTNAGSIVADGYSIAWRVLNAQFWGVPQRRRRIFLVADFGGQRAGEICFKPESMSWHSAASRTARKRATGAFAESVGAASGFMSGQGSNARSIAYQEEVSPTLRSEAGGNSTPSMLCAAFNGHKSVTGNICYAEDSTPNMETKMPPNVLCLATQQGGAEIGFDLCPTITAAAGMSGNNQPVLCYNPWDTQSRRIFSEDGVFHTLAANSHGGQTQDGVLCAAFDTTQITSPHNRSRIQPGEPCFTLGVNAHPPAIIYAPNVAHGLRAKANLNFREDGDTLVVYDAGGNGTGSVSPTITGDHNGHISDYTAIAIDCRNDTAIPELSGTLQAKSGGGTSLNYINPILASGTHVVGTLQAACADKQWLGNQEAFSGEFTTIDNYIARRLTPTECARLQGMPDWWCADVPHKDAPEYKMWGNGMAFPCVLYLMENLAEETAIRIMEEALI